MGSEGVFGFDVVDDAPCGPGSEPERSCLAYSAQAGNEMSKAQLPPGQMRRAQTSGNKKCYN